MSIRVNMFNVGDADAIIIQLVKGIEQLNLVVDGGRTKEHANQVIDYLEQLRVKPQVLICTHLDRDHIGGLGYILQEYQQGIQGIWVHLPERHDKDFKISLQARIVMEKAFSQKVDERLELILASVQDLENFVQIAKRLGMEELLLEPFSDDCDKRIDAICRKWGIEILGPSKRFYKELVPYFRESYKEQLYEYAKAEIDPCSKIGKEGYDTPENESSLIFRINNNGKNYLFTGDAGLLAFEKIEHELQRIYWLKGPHHGSKKNLNSEIIEKIGPEKCFISAIGIHNHPDRNLVECLKKHGTSTISCTGSLGIDLIEES